MKIGFLKKLFGSIKENQDINKPYHAKKDGNKKESHPAKKGIKKETHRIDVEKLMSPIKDEVKVHNGTLIEFDIEPKDEFILGGKERGLYLDLKNDITGGRADNAMAKCFALDNKNTLLGEVEDEDPEIGKLSCSYIPKEGIEFIEKGSFEKVYDFTNFNKKEYKERFTGGMGRLACDDLSDEQVDLLASLNGKYTTSELTSALKKLGFPDYNIKALLSDRLLGAYNCKGTVSRTYSQTGPNCTLMFMEDEEQLLYRLESPDKKEKGIEGKGMVVDKKSGHVNGWGYHYDISKDEKGDFFHSFDSVNAQRGKEESIRKGRRAAAGAEYDRKQQITNDWIRRFNEAFPGE